MLPNDSRQALPRTDRKAKTAVACTKLFATATNRSVCSCTDDASGALKGSSIPAQGKAAEAAALGKTTAHPSLLFFVTIQPDRPCLANSYGPREGDEGMNGLPWMARWSSSKTLRPRFRHVEI